MKWTYEEWLEFGIQNNYCSPPYCGTHNGYPSTETEQELWERGSDPCVVEMRLGNYDEWEEEARSYLEAE
jgi:hypothetical protein